MLGEVERLERGEAQRPLDAEGRGGVYGRGDAERAVERRRDRHLHAGELRERGLHEERADPAGARQLELHHVRPAVHGGRLTIGGLVHRELHVDPSTLQRGTQLHPGLSAAHRLLDCRHRERAAVSRAIASVASSTDHAPFASTLMRVPGPAPRRTAATRARSPARSAGA